jgi:hypothetical protein
MIGSLLRLAHQAPDQPLFPDTFPPGHISYPLPSPRHRSSVAIRDLPPAAPDRADSGLAPAASATAW